MVHVHADPLPPFAWFVSSTRMFRRMQVYAVAVFPDDRLASGSANGEVKIWAPLALTAPDNG